MNTKLTIDEGEKRLSIKVISAKVVEMMKSKKQGLICLGFLVLTPRIRSVNVINRTINSKINETRVAIKAKWNEKREEILYNYNT